jgi:photosystem II stability/assembly factor-like uncharacterized protein
MTPIRKSHRTVLIAALAFAAPVWSQDEAVPEAPPAAETAPEVVTETAPTADAATPVTRSEIMPLAARQALVLDFAEADSRAVAVCERGQVFLSESRRDWRQVADVPTRANLTAVTAVGDQVWAVGHDGTILHSADGGQRWTMQRSDPWQPLSDDMEFDPRQGVPLLDILMLDSQNGFAVGAYTMMLRTRDGGQTWSEVNVSGDSDNSDEADPTAATTQASDDSWTFDEADLELEEESDPHLNAIARTGDGSLFVVAERGAAFRSRDGGETWQRLQLPYEGSMFGVIGYDAQRVLAFGMRGNAFESADLGDNWNALDTNTELSLMGGAALPNGGAALVGANGIVLIRNGETGAITTHTFQTDAQETPVLSSVLAQSSSALVVGGEKGVGQFQVQAQAQ